MSRQKGTKRERERERRIHFRHVGSRSEKNDVRETYHALVKTLHLKAGNKGKRRQKRGTHELVPFSLCPDCATCGSFLAVGHVSVHHASCRDSRKTRIIATTTNNKQQKKKRETAFLRWMDSVATAPYKIMSYSYLLLLQYCGETVPCP